MYFTDRGIEELENRRGEEEVSFAWLAERLRTFVDLHPDFEIPVERLEETLGLGRHERKGATERTAAAAAAQRCGGGVQRRLMHRREQASSDTDRL
jgi:hypothetical protein